MIGAILRVRMASSRLPGKVLLPAAGKRMLLHTLERLRRSQLLDPIVVATSEDASDDPIVDLCKSADAPCFRGSLDDVLDRFYQCATAYQMQHIAEFKGDNPLIDPVVCDQIGKIYLDHVGQYDYVTNNHPPTYPDGQEVEIFPYSALATAWKEAKEPFQREHVTPFIWDQPERFRVLNVRMDPNLHHERWTLDYPEDYTFLRAVFEGLYPGNPAFSMKDVIRFLDAHPELRKINEVHAGYTWYTAHAQDLKTIEKKTP